MNQKTLVIFKIVITFIIIAIPLFVFKEHVINFIKENIVLSVFINLILTTLITGFFKLIFDKQKVKYEVSKQIEFELETEPIKKRISKFESKLNKSKEIYLKEYEKNITGFNKLLDKKYEIYPINFAKLIYIFGEMDEWIKTESLPTFSDFNEQDIINYLNTFEVGEVFKRKFKEKWENSDPKLEAFFTENIYTHFNKLRLKALNYFNNNRIFFSTEIEKITDFILVSFGSIINDLYYHHSAHNRVNKYDELEKKLIKTQHSIVELKDKIRSELSKPNCNFIE